MNFLKNIIILLLVLGANKTAMAHGTPKLFSFDEAGYKCLAVESATNNHVSLKRNFIFSENKTRAALGTSSAYYKQTVIRKQGTGSKDLLTKLIRSNLKLSFRVSSTLNLTISYL